MARPLLPPSKTDHTTASSHSHASAPATSLLLTLLLVAAAVAAVVVSLCTSGKNARPRKQHRSSSLAPAPEQEQEQDSDGDVVGVSRNKHLLASLSGIGVKAAAVAKMVSWNRRSPPASGWSSGDDVVAADGDCTAEEEALWKKTIILGEFSGHIAHDSDGNPMQPQAQPPAINKADDAAAEG